MNNFVFYSPTEFVFGKDTEGQTGTLAKKYNARKAMIVYGGGSIIRSGLLQRIEDSLQQAGVDYVKLGGVKHDNHDCKTMWMYGRPDRKSTGREIFYTIL